MTKRYSHRAYKFDEATRLRRKARYCTQVRSAAFETLEGRTLLSTAAITNSISLTGGVLYIEANPTVGCNLTANLTDNGKEISASADNHHAMTVPLSSVSSIDILGGAGNDYIYVDQNITKSVTIDTGDGSSTIRGGGGFNTIDVGNGNNWINARGTGENIQAGNGNDTILGANGTNTMLAGNGNDSIYTGAGNDSITAGSGNDSVDGGAGNDTIVAGNGKDLVYTGKGKNDVTVGTGADTIYPGTGSNYIVLGSSQAVVEPSSGKNTVLNAVKTINTPGSVTPVPISVSPTPSIPTWVTYSANPATGTAPRAIMQVLSTVPTVGIAVNTRALNSTLGYGSPTDANYQWNFGDPTGEYNTLPGFNASHIYTQPGTYTITLTVTNALYQTSTVSTQVTISADTRRLIYVNTATGSDNNNGLTPQTAVQSAAKADSLVGNNTEVLFARGQTFNLASAFELHYSNVLVGAYGTGPLPVINYTAPSVGCVIFSTNSHASAGVTIEDLTLTTLNGKDPDIVDQPMGVMAGGFGTTVLGCTFDYVEYDVNASGAPVGLTVENNQSPIDGGLEGYFLWNQGTDTTVIDNYVNGSVHEHDVRTSGAVEQLFYENYFNNFDGKGGIEIHVGSYAWIDSNTVNSGDIRVGPLGLWGEAVTDTTSNCVIENNHVNNTFIAVDPGAQNISIRSNIISRDDSQLIDVTGQNDIGMQAENIQILDNTGILTSTTGNFVKVENHTINMVLQNNLLVQPELTVGGYNSAPVFVNDTSMSDFTYINGNVWQEPGTFTSFSPSGINYIGTSFVSSGYLSSGQWNSLTQVGTDYFSNTPLTSDDAPSAGSLASTVDSPVAGVFTNIYGTARSQSGKWAAGAV